MVAKRDKAKDESAVAQIEALAKVPGALQIITVEEAKKGDPDPKAVAHWVCHDVVEIEGPDDRGRYTAHSAEGDWTYGYPADLLARLTEAGRS